MNVTIRDEAALRLLSPLNVALFLRTGGWIRAAHEPGRYSIWAKSTESEGVAEVLLPERESFADYAHRMADLLAKCAKLEGRSELDLFWAIRDVMFDVHRFRSPATGSFAGTVPLDEGVALVTTARDMIVAVACTVEEARGTIPRRRPKQVDDALRSALFGQTEAGSYVVKAQLPVAPKFQREMFEERPAEPEPFERRVGLRLIEATKALKEAAIESAATGERSVFLEAVRYGVSADLCSAIAEFQEKSRSEVFEISVAWAAARPLSAVVPTDLSVSISHELLLPLRVAAEVIRERGPIEGVVVYGYPEVLALPRQKQLIGNITISAQIPELGPGLHRIIVQLGLEDYRRAFDIQQAKGLARVAGDLVNRRGRWHLVSAHDFGAAG